MKQVVIILVCLLIGELIVYLTGVKLPSSIIGMLLLTLSLQLGWVKIATVSGISSFLTQNMSFFFVPPGVAIMLYLDVIQTSFWSILIASLVSTILVLAITGWTHQLFIDNKSVVQKKTNK
ncbi:murein hydrolase transporter LrgA [Wenyingzhuangia fucanilytica]|uniref:Murein hydrolase transporter LrgA n=1 Tax=Wenyingzhuangia fucanilytica TaxID=1790137 RepID=A0A1B1Y588_9FLAO|nr:CidA/LrgA family protein [Wenyingzhuangia fucanilytica]ANW95909.1 murein hydrolase transporter LrgA [Wenyingzhuangia fucanilytica]